MTIKEWKQKANTRFQSKEAIKKYQQEVKKNPDWKIYEQEWIDTNVTPLMDFMGALSTWKSVLKTNNLEIFGLESRVSVNSITRTGPASKMEAVYQGTILGGGHWYSRKKGQSRFFNSYNEYQILGTNIWCQTFALMNVANRLPRPFPEQTLCKYYYYNYYTLLFIKECLQNISKDKNLKRAVNQCLLFPNICINAIEIDFNTISISKDDDNSNFPSNAQIKLDFEAVKQENTQRQTLDKNDFEFYSIKELKEIYQKKNLSFKSNWKKMDFFQNFK